MTDGNTGFLFRAQKVFFYLGAGYVFCIILLAFPYFQRQALYLHNVHWPLFARFDAPHYHGLAPFKTLNLKLTTPDNVQIGAWFVLSDAAYKRSGAFNRTGPPSPTEVTEVLKKYPTVLFFHGNAASRAVKYRTQFYGQVSGRLRANLLVIDYRGFGDSESYPSELGLNLDARTSWDWLVEKGADPKDIIIVGQSLGTGVATKLTSQLAEEGISPRGLVLTAAFSTVPKLLETYSFGGYVHIFRPLQVIPYATIIMDHFVHTRYETISVISDVQCPILLVHARDDDTIPHSHSADLFNKLLDPLLPPWPFSSQSPYEALSWTADQLNQISHTVERRSNLTNQIVATSMAGPVEAPFGTVRAFTRPEEQGGQRVVWLEMEVGGHTEIVRSEGVTDYIGWMMGIDDGIPRQ